MRDVLSHIEKQKNLLKWKVVFNITGLRGMELSIVFIYSLFKTEVNLISFKSFIQKVKSSKITFATLVLLLAILVLPSDPISDALVSIPLFFWLGMDLYVAVVLVVLFLLWFTGQLEKIKKMVGVG